VAIWKEKDGGVIEEKCNEWIEKLTKASTYPQLADAEQHRKRLSKLNYIKNVVIDILKRL